MAEEEFLTDRFLGELTAVGEVDILVGIPTSNNAGTVGQVVTAAQAGLIRYFPRARAVVINADANSRDGTAEAVIGASIESYRALLKAAPLRTMHRLTTSYHPNFGKGGAWHIFAAAADLLRAKACAVFSPDLASFTPEWVDYLVKPVYKEGFDLVAPVYQRPALGGLLIKNIVSPMVQGVYGRSLREPAGTEIGFSGKLASQLLNQQAWQEEAVQLAPELWATTTAVVSNYRIGQSYLGPRVPASKRSLPDVVTSIREVVGALFRFIEMHSSFWTQPKNGEPVPNLGAEYSPAAENVHVQRVQMLQTFRNGVTELASILQSILSPPTLADIRTIASLNDEQFQYPDDLWVKTVYDFEASFHHSVMNRDHLLQALVPLYQGRVGAFVAESQSTEPVSFEQRLEGLSRHYVEALPYLIERWGG
ncbi:MAG TPA: glycosyl transferase family 2 [Terriglobia bacterium]|nr:glycosyl transferase family 2 [Terriglobia bacterium]